MQIITCPNCSAQLLASRERAPKCGKCGAPIPIKIQKEPGFFARLRARLFTNNRPAAPPPQNAYPHLQAKVDMLARKTWGSREDIKSIRLELPLQAVGRHLTHSEVVGALLKHLQHVAPNISVPMMTPRVVTEPMTNAAGLFTEQDGWVKISVSAAFFDNMPAALSILCHEVCHYILFANGIRQKPDLENERLTDTAIFVFGLGDIFLAGYSRSANNYRPGHRVGYLSDDEFQFLKRYVPQLRVSEPFLRTAKREDDWRWDRSMR